MSPTSKSSKWRPNGRSWSVTVTSQGQTGPRITSESQGSWTGTPRQASIGGRAEGNRLRMSGGPIDRNRSTPPSGAAESTALEWSERQVGLWQMTLRARYAVLVAVAIIALLPIAQPHGRWIAALTIFVLLPYNALYDVWMRRTGRLSPLLAFSDQVLGVALFAYAPEFYAPFLFLMLAVNATSAVAFGRRGAGEAALVGAIGFAALVAHFHPAGGWASLAVYLICSMFLITVVGGISEIEREVRGRYVELMGGIDAVVWEQLTHSPTTLYVNRRTEELLGYPALDWGRPGFWADHVHPDDVDWVSARYQSAVKAGTNAELEYRFISADGRVVHLHDRMRVEVGPGPD